MSELHIQDYVNTHGQLEQIIDGLSEDQLRWKAAPQSWSVQEVVSHLVDHSFVISFRIRDILANTSVQLPAFEQDAWVIGQHSNDGNVNDILEVFRSLLQYNSLLFRRLSVSDWNKSGVNSRGETVSVADIVRGFVKHVEGHLGQIERTKLAAISSEVQIQG
ncbi:DinB family protein [Paenibacillus pini]|uniref:DinB-like domain-containing protein n=1 Tax=Paenibacillus pini JCM 16418 TaxID=1236976 RepID=W7YBB3_9BACL|nr:DinB family protein [Paenibacillus pini]GAF08110.1 hypothetical protein JCM16418_2148 [Paenibacillus pini JCM 16418]